MRSLRHRTLLPALLPVLLTMAAPLLAWAEPQACIDAVQICEIVNGRRRETIIPAEKLKENTPIELQGHIAGITLICPTDDLRVEMSDDRFVTDQRVLILRNAPSAGADGKSGPSDSSPGGGHRLTIVPKIAGDCISSRDALTLALSSRGKTIALDLRQSGYRPIHEAPAFPSIGEYPLVFRYLGGAADKFRSKAATERFAALTDGIRRVETQFGCALVQGVNIIELRGHDNALSIKGHEEFWIYGETFWGYRPAELSSMAAHEAMHIVVDRGKFAGDPAIRELYADLMGFAPGSAARHAMMASGRPPRGYVAPEVTSHIFWGFINEKHFIDGMSGGHADDDVDEFCTSFLHSLLFIDRLEENLAKPLSLPGEGAPRVMTRRETEELLARYIQALTIFQSAAGREPMPGAVELFERSLQKVRGRMTGAAPAE